MTVSELSQRLDARMLTECGADREVLSGLCCDVISRAMTRGTRGMAWITMQANMNALAAAAMTGAACLILSDGMSPEADVTARAEHEGIALLTSDAGAFELAGRLYEAGIRGEEQKT